MHTYGGPYLDFAGETDDSNDLCSTATEICPISRDDHQPVDADLTGDAGFRRYRDFIEPLRKKRPVYITETNTSGYKHDHPGFNKPTPVESYVNGWIQETYEEIRDFNGDHNENPVAWPPVLCLCWFVDSDRDPQWVSFALSNDRPTALQQARTDFKASDTATGIGPDNPVSNLGSESTPIVEHHGGVTTRAPFVT